MVAVGDTAGLVQYVNEHAPSLGLDPAAVLSAARVEGWSGAIGDGGLAYGPWQDHMTEFTGRGPWFGAGKNNSQVQIWAWSNDGINQAMSEMVAAGVKGKSGLDALHAMIFGYERSSDMPGEYNNAKNWYNSFNNGSAVGTTPGDTSGTAGGDAPADRGAVAGGMQLVAGASSGSESVPSLFGNQDLGKAVARLTSPGFWWAAGLMILAGVFIILGLVIYFHKDIESAAGTVARGAALAA
jgi:hypothetical protein